MVHPFTRLASVFLNMDKDGSEFSSKLKSEIKKFGGASDEKLDFKLFVRFLLEANLGSSKRLNSDETEVKKVLKKLLPYHYQCPVCHWSEFFVILALISLVQVPICRKS